MVETGRLSVVQKAWRYYREHGLQEFVYRIQRRLEYVVFVKELKGDEPPPERPDVGFRVAAKGDVPLLAEIMQHWGADRNRVICEKLAAGETAVVGIDAASGQGAFVSWLAASDPQLVAVLSSVSPDEDVCSRHLFVPEAFRGCGIAATGLRFAEHVAAEQGRRRIWAFIVPDNIASQQIHVQVGYRRYGLLRVGRQLGRRFAQLRQAGENTWRPARYPE